MRQGPITYFIVLCCLVLLSTTSSCHVDPDYSIPINTIDSLQKELNEAADDYQNSVSMADTTWSDTVLVQLSYIQKNFRGIMKKDMAEILRDYRNIPKALPVIYRNDVELNYMISFAANQLNELKQTLTSKATHDAAGNPIDELYVQTALSREIKNIDELKRKMQQNQNLYVSVHERYLSQYPTVKSWVDSLPEKRTHQ